MIKRIFIACLACVALSIAAFAAPTGGTEVDRLLARLAASGCQFQRNGSWHNAAEARDHLAKKYRYLMDKRPQSTAEDFVALAATKSSISGKAYLVKCGDQREIPSKDWMTEQLRQLRAAKAATP